MWWKIIFRKFIAYDFDYKVKVKEIKKTQKNSFFFVFFCLIEIEIKSKLKNWKLKTDDRLVVDFNECSCFSTK